ncbi:MAG: SsrA-binding protein SmpB [Myxococcales bacterium]|nr:SsrA-binding protein SmpB [Myxococcales bacterium]
MGVKKKKGVGPGEELVCTNPNATRRYEIEDRFEAGLVLQGSEVKSLRNRKANLDGAYASVDNGEVWLHKMHIGPYELATVGGHEPSQRRKLLLHRGEVSKIHGKLTVRGYTLVPLKVYFKNGWAKIQIGLGKGKNIGDRRQDLHKKAAVREARDAVRRGKQ